MSDIKDGGPAFPRQQQFDPVGQELIASTPGMSLRDYFAIHATDADVNHQQQDLIEQARCIGGSGVLPDNWRAIARYMHADAMLKAREQ